MKLSYNYEQAAEAVGVSVSTIKALVAEGELVPRYIKSKPVILHDELQDYLTALPDSR